MFYVNITYADKKKHCRCTLGTQIKKRFQDWMIHRSVVERRIFPSMVVLIIHLSNTYDRWFLLVVLLARQVIMVCAPVLPLFGEKSFRIHSHFVAIAWKVDLPQHGPAVGQEHSIF